MSTAIGNESLGSLGSLAQSARTKQLKSARGILLACGILTIILNTVDILAAPGMLDRAIQEKVVQPARANGLVVAKAELEEIRARGMRLVWLYDGAAILIGVIFVVCGIVVYRFPVPATIISLILYLGAAAVFGYLNPTTLWTGWWIKLIVVAFLFKAVQAAIAYESERKASPDHSELSELPASPI